MSTVPAWRKRATIRDVAVETGVSRGTVSRVVNNEPYVSAQSVLSQVRDEEHGPGGIVLATPIVWRDSA